MLQLAPFSQLLKMSSVSSVTTRCFVVSSRHKSGEQPRSAALARESAGSLPDRWVTSMWRISNYHWYYCEPSSRTNDTRRRYLPRQLAQASCLLVFAAASGVTRVCSSWIRISCRERFE
ncbi:hypothetical protein DL93DRAFT_1063784 [Clavulina sp. PMI_390]|nr:hypothetical protein DL93DRAFT_1063784 [Clavulina sp. PMI_390]